MITFSRSYVVNDDVILSNNDVNIRAPSYSFAQLWPHLCLCCKGASFPIYPLYTVQSTQHTAQRITLQFHMIQYNYLQYFECAMNLVTHNHNQFKTHLQK